MRYLVVFVLVLGLKVVSTAQELPPKQAYAYDVKQIHSGHSLTDPLFGQPWPGQYVDLMTGLRGTWAGDDIGKATIPGSPMRWRWDNETTLQPTSARYNISEWELLVITEGVPMTEYMHDDSKMYLSSYVNNAWDNGNDGNGTPTLLWTTWTNIDDSDGPWRATLDSYESIWEGMMDYANENRPSGATPVYIIPGHRLMARLYDDIQAGQVPGITHINQFFSDNIHVNTLGAYAVAMIHYACIYNQSPVGLPNDFSNENWQYNGSPTPEQAAYLQNMIWDVVTNYDRTGVTNGVLPVELVEFEGSATAEGNALTWKTASEVNYHGFFVERSADSVDFKEIGFVQGKGTTSEPVDYEYLDTSAVTDINYYRLKQVDLDGKFQYSTVISISRTSSTENVDNNIDIYPNPFSQDVYIRGAQGKAIIYKLTGQIVKEFDIDNDIHLVDLQLLPKGIYILKVKSDDNQIKTSRLVKM